MSTNRSEQIKSGVQAVEKGFLAGIFEALGDKHSQLDINFQRTTIRMPGMQTGVEINGLITISVHMRELTEEEKKASAEKNVAMMATTK
ncbi:MAG: hypothetical protein M1368_07630 [Thaumarchaeota archaeon]|nr:hypothetical protein [Nitrososphaerota archaeon]